MSPLGKKEKYVLWLPGWFPSKNNPLNGDFVWRHAAATGQYMPIIILNIEKNNQLSKKEKTIKQVENITIIHICYPVQFRYAWIERFISLFLYIKYCFSESFYLIQNRGKPLLIHVHIFQKSILAGWLLSLRWNIPFILTEHNSKFLKESAYSFHSYANLKKLAIKFLIQKPSMITTVSKVLANGIAEFNPNAEIKITPNVVNTDIFKINNTHPDSSPFGLLHISTLTENKQLDLILQAWDFVNTVYPGEFSFTIIGPKDKNPNHPLIHFLPERSQYEVALEMQRCKAFILFSGYETFGCVVIEALACGKPVILADIPISREIIQDGVQGFLATPGDPVDLAKKIIELRNHYIEFDQNSISSYVEKKYSYAVVGKLFADIYEEITNF